MAKLDDLIFAEGDDAKKAIETKPRQKTNYVKMKDGDQLRGFLLVDKFVMYMNHSDYNNRIKSHVCSGPKHGVDCLSCKHGVKRLKKTIVPFYNIDSKQVEIFDASNGAMKPIYKYVEQYEEEALTTPIVLSRSGNDTGTTYTIMPVRVKAAEKELFVVHEEVVINREFYENILQAPDEEYVRKLIGLAAEDGE
jgi:hypothetical protein